MTNIYKENFIDYIPNFLPKKEFDLLEKEIQNIKWDFNSFALNDKNENKFSRNCNYTFLEEDKPVDNFNNFIISKLNDLYNTKFMPHNGYFNSYQFGNEMEIHTDRITKINFNRTVILYINSCSFWDVGWGGQTLIFDKSKDKVLHSSIPFRNSLLVFDGLLPHGMVPLSRNCFERRIILVYQTEIK